MVKIGLDTFSKKQKIGTLLLGIGSGALVYYLTIFLEYPEYINPFLLLGISFVMIIVLIALHEGLHGIMFWLFTGKVKFGFKVWTKLGPVFWASSPGNQLPNNKYQVTALTPQVLTLALIVLTFSLELPSIIEHLMIWSAAMNMAGGCGDIVMVLLLKKYPTGVGVEDTQDGCIVHTT